jgi:glycosyltransferase involved in cell wall biosynthesis
MPPAAPDLLINGRFLGGAPTAVNRVARELTVALAVLAREPGTDVSVTVAVPPDLADAGAKLGAACEVLGRRTGIAWEQLDLPRLAGGRTVVGLFNSVPVRGRGHVTMLHDAQVFDAPESYRRPVRWWRQWLARRAGARGRWVLTNSDHSRRRLLARGIADPARIAAIPLGVEHLARHRPDAGILARLALGGPYFVALASPQPHKNLAVLLAAMGRPELAQARLVLTGAATREDFLARGLHPPANVTFAGFVSDRELRALYSSATAVCMPSRTEGFGLPPLEAMNLGTPAAVSTGGALPEVCGDAALYAGCDDIDGWVENLSRLADDPALRAELAARGQARAARFTWPAAARAALTAIQRFTAG